MKCALTFVKICFFSKKWLQRKPMKQGTNEENVIRMFVRSLDYLKFNFRNVEHGPPNPFLPIHLMPIEQTWRKTEREKERNKGKTREREKKDERKLSEKSWHKRLYRLSGKLFTHLDECLLTTKIRALLFVHSFLPHDFLLFFFSDACFACTKSQTSHRHQRKKEKRKERKKERKKERRWHYNTC